jgi:hypothetical protein
MQSEISTAAPFPNPAVVIPIVALAIGTILGWWLTDAIAQDPAYHLFADQRMLAGLPHAHDVLSNLPFCLAGLLGIFAIVKRPSLAQGFNTMYLVFFAAMLATGLGSAYYHLAPDNQTLVWDRLPMAVGFMSMFAIIIGERLSPRLGRRLFPWLLAAGIYSVIYWHWQDDLRPYALVQFGTLLALPLILLIRRRPDSGLLWLAIGFYLLAKIFEACDAQIYALTAHWVSGHSLKHLAASVTPLLILLRLSRAEKNNHAATAATRASLKPETSL